MKKIAAILCLLFISFSSYSYAQIKDKATHDEWKALVASLGAEKNPAFGATKYKEEKNYLISGLANQVFFIGECGDDYIVATWDDSPIAVLTFDDPKVLANLNLTDGVGWAVGSFLKNVNVPMNDGSSMRLPFFKCKALLAKGEILFK